MEGLHFLSNNVRRLSRSSEKRQASELFLWLCCAQNSCLGLSLRVAVLVRSREKRSRSHVSGEVFRSLFEELRKKTPHTSRSCSYFEHRSRTYPHIVLVRVKTVAAKLHQVHARDVVRVEPAIIFPDEWSPTRLIRYDFQWTGGPLDGTHAGRGRSTSK